MLSELRVENLGVIAELGLVLGPGMTVVTGETGAGKTLVVEAVELLVGARADGSLVRHGASEARVEARFELGPSQVGALRALDGLGELDDELVIARVVPAEGRSRAYLNGRLVPAGVLSEVGRHLVDLHGQHTHHALLSPATQRAALDRFAGEPAGAALAAYREARTRVREIEARLGELGGDVRERAREIDLLRFQVEEIDGAAIDGPDEDDRLRDAETVLADAAAHRDAAARAHGAIEDDVLEALGEAVGALDGRASFHDLATRLGVLQQEAGALAREVRLAGEAIVDDPAELERVGARRRLLHDLCRKYGETLADVVEYRDEVAHRLDALVGAEALAGELSDALGKARNEARAAAEHLTQVRRGAAGRLGAAVTSVVRELSMPGAEVRVEVGPVADPDALPDDGFDEVTFELAANPGEGFAPLRRVASGGELARTMLGARVVLTEAPPTLVFDEVDAGIGGHAGVAVGRKLALVAESHQVFCVTHLAQVAAFADAHAVVEKHETSGRTVARARMVDGTDRVAELSRMLAGTGTARARDHAEELLASAARERRG